MSDLSVEEAQQGFRETLDIHLQKTWGEHLTEDQHEEIMETVAELVAVYMVSMEPRWCFAHPDILSLRFRGRIETILQDAFDRVNAFVIADSIADFSADAFNQMMHVDSIPGQDQDASSGTSAMDVRPTSPGTNTMNSESEDKLGDPIIVEDKGNMRNDRAFSSTAALDEGDQRMADYTNVGDNSTNKSPADEILAFSTAGNMGMAMDIATEGSIANEITASALTASDTEHQDIDAIGFEDSNEMNEPPTTVRTMELDGQDDEHEDGDDAQQAEDTAVKKGKDAQQSRGGKIDIDHHNNPLYSEVINENNPNGPPKYYKCKIAGCGRQGVWNARQPHFEIKHAKEWKDVTGREAKVLKCPACEYTTIRSNYIPRHIKKEHPELEAAKAKKGKKSKK